MCICEVVGFQCFRQVSIVHKSVNVKLTHVHVE